MLEEITPINFFFITLYNIIVFRNYQHDFALKSFHPSYLWFLKKKQTSPSHEKSNLNKLMLKILLINH